jgi:hypothetical protein
MGRETYREQEKFSYDYIASLLSNRLLKYEQENTASKLISLLVQLFTNIGLSINGEDDASLLTGHILPLQQTQELLNLIHQQGDSSPEWIFAKQVELAFLTPDILISDREENMNLVYDWIVKEEAYNNNIFMDEQAAKIERLSSTKSFLYRINESAHSAEFQNLVDAFQLAHKAIGHDEKVARVKEMKLSAILYIDKTKRSNVFSNLTGIARERIVFANDLIRFASDFRLDPRSSDYQIAMGNIIGNRDDYVKEEIINQLLENTKVSEDDLVVRSFLKHYFNKDELLQAIKQYENGILNGFALRAFYDVANYTNEQKIKQMVSRPVAYIV